MELVPWASGEEHPWEGNSQLAKAVRWKQCLAQLRSIKETSVSGGDQGGKSSGRRNQREDKKLSPKGPCR